MSNDLVLTFENTAITVLDRDGRPWVTAADLGRALGYAAPKGGSQIDDPLCGDDFWRPITQIYDRNADEFTPDMTALIVLETAGGPQKVRVFSPRGCHLVGMLSRTDRAKTFRRWVLDVLEQGTVKGKPEIARHVGENAPDPLPLIAPRNAAILRKYASRKLTRRELTYIRHRGKYIGKTAAQLMAQYMEWDFVEKVTALVLAEPDHDFVMLDDASDKVAARTYALIDTWKYGVF